ncbi:MAG: hypothetical protein HXX11_20545 [Desulfuromonadales bacterium]|nr:hypothetical protein [Desulfuromonadales bacterium]
MNTSEFVRRIDELIEVGNRILATHRGDGIDGSVTTDAIREFRQKSASFIAKIHGCNPTISVDCEPPAEAATLKGAEQEMAALRAIREEIRYAGEFGH